MSIVPEPTRPSLDMKATVPAVRYLSRYLTLPLTWARSWAPQPVVREVRPTSRRARPAVLSRSAACMGRLQSEGERRVRRAGGAAGKPTRCAGPAAGPAHLATTRRGGLIPLPVRPEDLAPGRGAGRPPRVGIDAVPDAADAAVHQQGLHGHVRRGR